MSQEFKSPAAGIRKAEAAEELQESIEELRALHELNNMCRLLREENDDYREQIIAITAELEGINVSIAESEEYIGSYDEKKEISLENITSLSKLRNTMTEELNRLQLRIKAVANDVETSMVMQETLQEEFYSIQAEKEILIARIKDVESGILELKQQKQHKLPRAREHDEIYNRIYKVFKEAENRMEVTVQFRSR